MEVPPHLPLKINEAGGHYPSPASKPPALVRIVIPAFRATDKIRDTVVAVLKSRGSLQLEVVVVDDGDNVNLEKALSGLPVSIMSTGGSGSAAFARNAGAGGFDGAYIVFVDSDVSVSEFCIDCLLRPMRNNQADATVGNYSKNVAGLPFASRYKQLYISRVYERRAGYLTNEFWTAAGAIDAAVFRRLNGFDSCFKGAGGEDTELGVRLTSNGYRVMAVPEALSDHRHAITFGQLLKNDWRKGMLTMGCFFHSEGTMVHNRHATRRDIIAVGLADFALAISIVAPVLHGFVGRPLALTLIFALLGYVTFRADILRVFLSQGILFVVRAFGVMFLLDLMRSACFAAGIGLRLRTHVAERLGAPLRAPNRQTTSSAESGTLKRSRIS
jgi:glycosyltransferase involved in cell wall biosynthesis